MAQTPPPTGAGVHSGSDITSELESFRQQWRAEVQAKTTEPGRQQQSRHAGNGGPVVDSSASGATAPASVSTSVAGPLLSPLAGTRRGSVGAPHTPLKLPVAGKKPILQDSDEDYVQPRAFDDPVVEGKTLADGTARVDFSTNNDRDNKREPRSALEHYEKAVEREAQGTLGDSLRLYRTAFRMDSAVDKKYKEKHFPAPPPAAAGATSAGKNVPVTTAVAAGKQPVIQDRLPPPTLKELIASFAGLAIEGAPPPVEGLPSPPCPLAALPDELLVHVLRDVAVADVGDFVRLARVCKKLAFLVATEDQIWRRVCMGPEFGFERMHRAWQRAIAWGPLDGPWGTGDDAPVVEQEQQVHRNLMMTLALRKPAPTTTAAAAAAAAAASAAAVTASTPLYSSWQQMFRRRPRVRFNGCYISTVNYIRAGQPSANLVTWNSPVHIVTYFRYLRFFRDGTVISLLTTAEPADVVHYLTKDLVALHRDGVMAHLPSAVMQQAFRGRWRMSGIEEGSAGSSAVTEARTEPSAESCSPSVQRAGAGATAPDGALVAPPPFSSLMAAIGAESDLVVETEGVGKYYYRMELTFGTAGKGTRNNKLNWRGFYSYDRLTDDWSEFGLKNYRPFFFSRVKSYGVGE
ncbi:f-box protein [Niveomyces insectorum RCEF 264]|uniref:F-box protein n=1 Tax=Niveomyces insectorum RCEF 264 TaxID=1081102 RepID=A0A167MGV7_9HYPO|nr:f-box protein [Niveomyces insectorum RCEF 264]